MDMTAFRRELSDNADEKYRVFQQALIPGVTDLIGVRRPVLRKIASRIAKESGREFIRQAKRESFEEIAVKGLVIAGLMADTAEILKYTAEYVPEITDWCLCDTFCSDLKAARKDRETFWEFLAPYLTSDQEFEARFAAVMLLNHFICDEWIDRVLEALFTVRQEGYYAQMAVAWAYSMCYVKYPEKTEAFLAVHRLPEFTYKKTVSKIRDSLPVPKEDKERLKRYGFGGGRHDCGAETDGKQNIEQ